MWSSVSHLVETLCFLSYWFLSVKKFVSNSDTKHIFLLWLILASHTYSYEEVVLYLWRCCWHNHPPHKPQSPDPFPGRPHPALGRFFFARGWMARKYWSTESTAATRTNCASQDRGCCCKTRRLCRCLN